MEGWKDGRMKKVMFAGTQSSSLPIFRDRGTRSLGEDVVDDVAVDVGEAVLAALEFVGEGGVVDAELVEDGGLEVVDVDAVLGDIVPEVVGGAVS